MLIFLSFLQLKIMYVTHSITWDLLGYFISKSFYNSTEQSHSFYWPHAVLKLFNGIDNAVPTTANFGTVQSKDMMVTSPSLSQVTLVPGPH